MTPAATFAVGRVSRNLGGAGARVGGLVVARRDDMLGDGVPGGGVAGVEAHPSQTNVAATVDAYVRLGQTARVEAFVSGTHTAGGPDAGAPGAAPRSGYAHYLYAASEANWGYVGYIHDLATSGYDPQTGFVFRRDVVLNSPAASLDLRPRWLPRGVRSLQPSVATYVYHRLSDGAFLQGDVAVRPVEVVFANAAEARLVLRPSWQRIDADEAVGFRPLGVALAAGRYRYVRAEVGGFTDRSRRLALAGTASVGGFYDGRLVQADVTATVAPSPRLGLSLRYELNRAWSLGPQASSSVVHLVAPRVRVALTPRLQGTALYQYNSLSGLAAWAVRLAWEFRPLSFVYVALNDNRFYVPTARRAEDPALYDPQQQAVVKVSYLRQL